MQTEEVFYSRAVADRAGAKRYFGMVCKRHPELKGERSARNGVCIGCNKDKMRARRAANPEYHRQSSRAAYEKWYPNNKHKVRAYHREKNTGVSAEVYARLLEIQEGKCGLCQLPLEGRRPHADHCHDEKKPRGVLCATCNQLEGMVRRTGFSPVELGRRLAEYLAHPPAEKL